MIMGDGVLTPSVSVLSSMEGLAVADPSNPRLQKGERAPHAKSFKVFFKFSDEDPFNGPAQQSHLQEYKLAPMKRVLKAPCHVHSMAVACFMMRTLGLEHKLTHMCKAAVGNVWKE